jgi:hypothetical protein
MSPIRLTCLFTFGLLVAGLALPADFVPLAGPTKSGTLVRVDPDTVTFRTETGAEVKLPVKELAAIDLKYRVAAPAASTKYDEVELTDGSILKVGQFRIAGKKAEVTPLAGPNGVPPPVFQVPMGSMYCLMRGAEDAGNRDDWRKVVANRGKRDLFVIRQPAGLSPLPGTVIEGSETGDRVTFEREDGQRVTLPLTRATGGLIFNQPPRDAIPPTVCKLHDVFGNVLFATAVEVAGSGLKVRTVSGAEAAYPDLRGVSKLDFSRGNVSYLSDLAAVASAPPRPPDEPLELKPAQDRAVFGPDITIDGKKFTKGVSVPRDLSVSYKLDGTYREFKALAGIPDGENRGSWALRLRIEVDGRTAYNEVLSKKDRPKDITLNVKDAKEVRISVEADGLFAGGELSLAEARFQK